MRRPRALAALALTLTCCGWLRAAAPGQPAAIVAGAEPVFVDSDPASPSLSFRAEYLLWWIKPAPVPVPLLTASAGPSNPRPIPGEPGVALLFGGRDYDLGPISGGRLTACWEMRPGVALEVSGFLTQAQTRAFHVQSSPAGDPVLATPFFDVLTGTPAASFYSLPTVDGGSAAFDIALTSRLWGVEGNLTAALLQSPGRRVDALVGFRYLDIHERLLMQNQALFFAPTQLFNQFSFPANSTFLGFDDFATRNQFYGGQVGFRVAADSGRFALEAQAKIALGSMHQVLRIAGSTTGFLPGSSTASAVVPGDAFALLSNIGRSSEDHFAVVPEVGVNFGYQWTDSVRFWLGYSFLYVSNVIRPGDSVDPRLNPNLIPTFGVAPTGPHFPERLFRQSDLFVHGLNFGVGLSF